MNRNKKTAKRAMGMALAAVLLLSPLSYLGTETAYAATTYYNQKTEKTVTRGVTYEKSSRMTDAGIQNIHVLKVDLTESTLEFKEVESKTEGVKTLLVSTGEYFGNIGYVVFDGEKLTAKLWKCDSNILSDMYKPCDAEVAAVVNGRNEAVEAQLSAAFAKTEVDLDGNKAPGVRTQETNLGDFAADAILWSAQQAMGEQVVAALTNGGGIRASIKAGDITMKDMKTIFPFGNQVSVLTVTGAELLEALEAATFSTPDAIGAFPQVAGIVFTIDTTVPFEQGEQYPDSTYFAPKNPGARVTIETVGGQAFDKDALYTIATNDFTAAGGDTYYAFKYANATAGYKTGVALEDALVNYVQQVLGGVVGQQYAQPQGRITIK